MLHEARELAEATGLDEMPAVVLANAGWHSGVLGIVASRLVDLYGKPALMIALPAANAVESGHDAVGVGSGRSIDGFALHEGLRACGDLLVSHGGHAMAAGFRVRAELIDTLRERFCARAATHFSAGPPAPSLVLDAEAPLNLLT